MYQCPVCHNTFPTIRSRDEHVFAYHNQQQQSGSGWFEEKRPTPNGDKAIAHMIAQEKLKMAQNRPLDKPIPMPAPPKAEFQPVSGFTKAMDNSYMFERLIYRYHTPYNTIDFIVRSRVTNNHAEAILHKFDKDISEVFELQRKCEVLESRLASMVVSDYAFSEVSKQIYDVKKRISEITRTLKAEETTELLLEDFYQNNNYGSEEHDVWRKRFMEQVLSECTRIEKNLKNTAFPDEPPEKSKLDGLINKLKPS